MNKIWLLMLGMAMAASVKVAADPINLDIVYLPHGPVMKVMKEIDGILAKHPEAKVKKVTFEEKAGKKLAESHGLTGHMPILLVVNKEYKHQVNGELIEFYNFPSNVRFAPMFQGSWAYEDLDILLADIAGKE